VDKGDEFDTEFRRSFELLVVESPNVIETLRKQGEFVVAGGETETSFSKLFDRMLERRLYRHLLVLLARVGVERGRPSASPEQTIEMEGLLTGNASDIEGMIRGLRGTFIAEDDAGCQQRPPSRGQ
jgi:hypothetical protein